MFTLLAAPLQQCRCRGTWPWERVVADRRELRQLEDGLAVDELGGVNSLPVPLITAPILPLTLMSSGAFTLTTTLVVFALVDGLVNLIDRRSGLQHLDRDVGAVDGAGTALVPRYFRVSVFATRLERLCREGEDALAACDGRRTEGLAPGSRRSPRPNRPRSAGLSWMLRVPVLP